MSLLITKVSKKRVFFNHVERNEGSAKEGAASPRYPRGKSGNENQN